MRAARVVSTWIFGLMIVTGGLFAQESVPHLQDLVGARGGDGERLMGERGYTWVRTDKSGGDAYSYWRDNRSGRCVSVRTSDGRYASIVYTPDFDCRNGQDASAGSDERQDEFATVCGVAFEGKIHRHRCKVVDFYQGDKKTKTEVHFPDQTMRLRWQSANRVAVHVEGLETRHAEYRAAEGDINYFMDDKTYFYTADKEKAKREVADLEQ